MEFLNTIAQALAENWGTVTLTGVLSIVASLLVAYIVKKVIPNFFSSMLGWITKIVSQMFGIPQEGVSTAVKELPIVKQLAQQHSEFVEMQEIKLIELKNKLISPKLSDAEILTYKMLYDKILASLDYHVSVGTQKILDGLDELVKNRFNV